MNLYAFNTENKHKQILIFTSKTELLRWARAATSLKDIEILAKTQKLTQSQKYYNLFVK